ncbi:Pattern formation protein EMB30 AltName: Full=Protein EMBRYO DEFECTIVE 30 [Rhizoctonia solani AG-1 IB]|uniref:Rhizoctonia solani AG1-IB WGS project CAOJ00000000 data, isolate 7/3/14, contig 10089 n=1 Tax=Thanatephorus cucumeris (strain AG1-IB / isolate 7/3/14) TaxID=1108050 RepID=M5BU11_THACB|nr:Pattern formation protein EMB30 AltName: Full=Protein EMBRYO DEFECTIVE 30 [Rhizoctonia solani AG-1 IB]
MRSSEVLRRTAEANMQTIIQEIFGRLRRLDPVEEEQRMRQDEEEASAELKLALSPTTVTNPLPGGDAVVPDQAQAPGLLEPGPEPRPYGLPTVAEVLRVLINLLDPNDQQHTDTIRLTALGIITAALSACLPSANLATPEKQPSPYVLIRFPSLVTLLADRGCRHLFLLARADAPALRLAAFKAIATLFEVARPSLKLQRELFLSFLVARLEPIGPIFDGRSPGRVGTETPTGGPRPSTPAPGTPNPGLGTPKAGTVAGNVEPELRELMLEILILLSREPSFMVDLWANYDCDVNCEDIFERLVGFLTKSTYPLMGGIGGQQQYASRLLALDMLLAYVDRMHARAETPSVASDWIDDNATPDSLLHTKSQKLLVLTAAQKFNEKPKKGVAFMLENGLVEPKVEEESKETTEELVQSEKDKPKRADPKSLAHFLKNCPRLDKKVLGEYISHLDNPELLKEFIGLFDFHEQKSIADAMRELLESFRLPGESQPIARITETFAKQFFSCDPPGIKSEDAVFVLSYSVIMLNTDLHNPQNRKRMTIVDYQKNLKGVNDGTDFDPEYLQAIYDSLRKREIVMPEEHTGQLGFDYAWKELLLRSKHAGEYIVCNTSAFDKDMFELTWQPVIKAIAFAFTNIDDDYVIERAIAGFRQCATLAGYFKLPEVFDFVVGQLSQATGLLGSPMLSRSTVYPIVQVEGHDVTVSPLSVKFGTNLKGQLAAVVLFNIANGNVNAIRDGWGQVFEMFETLFFHSLLPTRMLQMEDFLGGVSMIPLQGGPALTPAQNRSDAGLLSALSSYLLTPYGSGSENVMSQPTDEDIENTMSAIDCVTSCQLDELYGQIMSLELPALIAAMKALQFLADRRASLKSAPADETQAGPTTPVDSSPSQNQLPYDPTSVFLLETMVSIVLQTSQHIEETWPIVFEHLSMILSSSINYSVLLVERAVVGLLRLCRIAANKPILRDQIYISLDILGGLPPMVFNAVTEQIVAGLALLVQEHPTTISSQTEWALVFSLLRGSIINTEASKTALDLLVQIASTPERVSPDNVNGLITSLEEFAIAAGSSAVNRRQKQARVPSSLQSNPIVERGVKAIATLAELKRIIAELGLSQDVYWPIWLNLLSVLGRQSANPCQDVRHTSLGHLQRILLGAQTPDERSIEMFDRVVLPMADELLKPQVAARDLEGFIETKLRASALLCRSFLHFQAHPESLSSQTKALWLKIIDIMRGFFKTGRRDQLTEAIPESLKNVLLVLNASGVLLPPASPDTRTELQQELWRDTVLRIDEFLPGLMEDLFPPPPEPEPQPGIVAAPEPVPES